MINHIDKKLSAKTQEIHVPEASSRRMDYKRSVATEEVQEFPGWEYIDGLVEQVPGILKHQSDKWKAYLNTVRVRTNQHRIEHPRSKKPIRPPGRPPKEVYDTPEWILEHKAFIVTLLKLGGRICEIIGLPSEKNDKNYDKWYIEPITCESISDNDIDSDDIIVRGLGVSKRYIKQTSYMERKPNPRPPRSQVNLWTWDDEKQEFFRRRWRTQRKDIPRRPFRFPKEEPMNDIMLDWVEYVRVNRGPKEFLFARKYIYWYCFLRELDPMKNKYSSKIVLWNHIYPHLFRALRATQLGQEYGMDSAAIADWGEWETLDIVRKYVGTEAVTQEKMRIGVKKHKERWSKIRTGRK